MKKNQPPTWLGWQLIGDSPGYLGTCQAVLVMVITQKANCLRERSPYPKRQRRIMAQHCTDACTFSEWQFIQQDGLVPCPRPLAEARPGLSETQRASPPGRGNPANASKESHPAEEPCLHVATHMPPHVAKKQQINSPSPLPVPPPAHSAWLCTCLCPLSLRNRALIAFHQPLQAPIRSGRHAHTTAVLTQPCSPKSQNT